MDFLDEDAKPRFLFQSRAQQASQISDPQTQPFNKVLIFISISISALLFALTFFFFNSEPINSLLFWVASSILLGPFAPASFTAGDISVGQGPIVQFAQIQDQEKPQFKQVKKTTNFSNGRGNSNTKSQQRSEESGAASAEEVKESAKNGVFQKSGNVPKMAAAVEEEGDWTEEDFELLKKQMAKHPAGMPRRWEVITGAFQGRRKMESVVKMAKSTPDKKLTDRDSFARFLKDRKPLDKRAESGNDELLTGGSIDNGENLKEKVWSSEEDVALLNALKAFPKEVSMRWEKITAAVPGKTKSACMKRVAELKRDFRTSKASSEA